MKELLMLIGTGLAVVGLIILQLKILKNHHSKAELLIDLFKTISPDEPIPKDRSNG